LIDMIERAFLDKMSEYMAAPARLVPTPKLVGVADPADVAELPAVVLSLANLERLGSGLGERSVLMTGALSWAALIDLANPVLPGEPSFALLSADRKILRLPHGGLVRKDGTTGTARSQDIQVMVDGEKRTLVSGPPGANAFQADLLSGTLIFGAALPPTGEVAVNYFIGQWEQRLMRLQGDLHAHVFAADVAAAKNLSDSLIAAIEQAPAHIAGLAVASVSELGTVGRTPQDAVAARQRLARFHFQYELEINIPDSSGGIIREVPVTAILE
jgi:hypothetical protein